MKHLIQSYAATARLLANVLTAALQPILRVPPLFSVLTAVLALSVPSLRAVTLSQAGYTDLVYGNTGVSSSFGNVATSAAGDVFFVGGFDSNLYRSVANSGTFSSYLNVGGTGLGLARNGNFLYVGVESQKILRIDLSAASPSAVQIGTISNNSPQALAIAPAGWGSYGGKLIIGGESQLYAMDLATGVSTQIGSLSRPISAIAFTASGVLLATDYNGSGILQIGSDGTTSTFRSLSSGGVDGMVIHPSTGKIYTFNSSTREIREIAADGSSDISFATGLSLNGGYYPSAAAFSATGDRLFYATEGGDIHVISGFPALTTNAATATTVTSATLNGVAAPTGLATTAWFEWGISPTLAGATSTSAQDVGSGTSTVAFSEPLSGLVQDTKYYFRAVMNNSSGTKYAQILSFITGPDIAVAQPAGTNLVDGAATVSFSSAAGVAGTARTFTLTNTGNLDLTDLAATVDGDFPGDYALSTLTTSTLAAGASTTLTVTFTAGAVGVRGAVLHIASNDPDENPFDIVLAGKGVNAVPGYVWTGNFPNVTSNSNSNWGSQFTAVDTCTLTHLGVYDHNQDGLSQAIPVGLWDATTQQLLASTTVSSGTVDPLFGSCRQHALDTPVVLEAGKRYVIAAFYLSSNDNFGYSSPITTDSRVAYYGYAYNYEGQLYFPYNNGTATASNAHYIGASFMLDTTPAAPSVTTQSPAVTDAGITLRSRVNPNSRATTVTFEYSLDPTLSSGVTTTAAQNLAADYSGQNVSSSLITGLPAFTTYYVRAVAVNSLGTTQGAIRSFTTSPPVPGYKFSGNSNSYSTQYYYDNNWGSYFTTQKACVLTHLGVYDHDQNGLNADIPVGIWDSGGNLLASTIVRSGTTDELVGSFRQRALYLPVTLAANTRYFIAAYYSNYASDPWGSGTAIQTDSRITYEGYTYNYYAGQLSFPGSYAYGTTSVSQAYYFGANFLLEAPVPAAPDVTTSAAVVDPQTSAAPGAKVSTNGLVTHLSFDYSLDPTLTTGVSTTPAQNLPASFDPATFYATPITGLTNNSTYYYRAVATNSLGTTQGAILSFKTNPEMPGYTFGNISNAYSNAGYTWGSEFTALTSTTLTHLGVYDHNQDGLQADIPVGLWDTNGNLLASTTVTSSDPLTGTSRYHALTTPVPLSANTRYLVAAYYTSNDQLGNNIPITTDTRIAYYGYAYDTNYNYGGLRFPQSRGTLSSSSAQFFGADFLLEQPPSAAPVATTSRAYMKHGNAILNASVRPGILTTQVTFEYSLDATLSTGVSTTPAQTVNGFYPKSVASAPVAGLPPDSTVYFRVVATNSMGTSTGSIISFKTSGAIWNGPSMTFAKAANSDWTQAANQDRLTANVWLTRASTQGLFNIATGKETSYDRNSNISPSDTEWAAGTTADFANLTFSSWYNWWGRNLSTIRNTDAVLHLITDDIYINIKFSDWGANNGGTFAYTRSTPGDGVVVGTPEIAVEQPVSTDVPSGGSKAFGTVNVGSTTDLVFTLKNTGDADLTLTGTPDKVVLTGSSDFTVTAQPSSPVTAAGSTTFTVHFAPTSVGPKTAALAIASDDLTHNPFNITLTGAGDIARGVSDGWTVAYGGPDAPGTLRSGAARAVAVQKSTTGAAAAVAVFATGFTTNAAGNKDIYTVRCNPVTGSVEWASTFNGGFNDSDEGMAIAVDGNGDVIVAGYTTVGASNTDVWVAKHNGTTGGRMWSHTFNGALSNLDGANSLAVDASGNIAVGGYTMKASGNSDIYAGKLATDGTVLWEGGYDGGNNKSDYAGKVVIDSSGNVVVAGYKGSSNSKKVCYAAKLGAANGAVIWTHSRVGAAGVNLDDNIYGLALDAAGNPVIAGALYSGSSYDLYVSKLQSSSVSSTAVVLWETITDPYGNNDAFYDVLVDGAGNVVAAGTSRGATNVHERLIAKYDGSSGVKLWDNRLNQGFSAAGNLAFNAKLAVDAENNVAVTGFAVSSTADATKDVYTAKLLAAGGDVLWEKTYPLPAVAGKNDEGYDVACSGAGDVYVAGYSGDAGGNTSDFLVLRYSATAPDTQQANVITFSTATTQHVGTSVSLAATAPGGRVHYSLVSGPAALGGPNTDVLSFTGVGTVVVRGRQAGSSQYAAAADTDLSITVQPGSQIITFSLSSTTSYMSTVDLSTAATASSGLAVSYSVQSGPGSIAGNMLSFSSTGSVVVRASQAGDANYNAAVSVDHAITADNSAPVIILSGIEQLFSAPYAGTGAGEVKAAVLDTIGGTINGAVITGYTTTSATGVDIRTAKYDGSGNLVWETIRAVNGTDMGVAVKLDASGNVYVAGYTTVSGTNTDVLVIKYDSAGVQKWQQTFTGTAADGGADQAVSLALASDGSVMVAGCLVNATSGSDFFAAKLSSSDGTPSWSQSYDGGFNKPDVVNALALTPTDDLVLAGYSQNAASNEDCYTVRVPAAGGAVRWSKRNGDPLSPPPPLQDRINAVGLDAAGDVIVTGFTQGANFDIYTAKYDGTTGTAKWEVVYNGPYNKNDASYDLKVDSAGDILVAATASDANAVNDALTLKFRGSTGAVAWTKTYNGPANKSDRMTLVGLDPNGNVISSGYSYSSNNTADIYTAKYDKNTGAMLWEIRYVGDGGLSDTPNAMVTDSIGGAWVGGYTSSASNVKAQLLLRYAPPNSTPQAPPPPGPAPAPAPESVDNLAFAAPLPAEPQAPAVTQAFMQIEQGDLATFSAQFVDPDGNNTVSFSADMEGTHPGGVLVSAESGDFSWQFDTSRLAPGEHQVLITAMDSAGASASVNLALTVNSTLPDRTWRWQNFGSTAAAGSAADNADPDGDGVSNLAEFAFGLNPNAPSSDTGTRAVAMATQQGMNAVFRRRKDYLAAGLTYLVEFSSNLKDWTPSSSTAEILGDDGVVQQAAVPYPPLLDGEKGKFFRVRVEKPVPGQ